MSSGAVQDRSICVSPAACCRQVRRRTGQSGRRWIWSGWDVGSEETAALAQAGAVAGLDAVDVAGLGLYGGVHVRGGRAVGVVDVDLEVADFVYAALAAQYLVAGD